MPLPVNIDSSNPDDNENVSVKEHQQHHDSLHALYNTYEGTRPTIVSTESPADPAVDQLWYDSVNSTLKRWNGTNWIYETSEVAHIQKADAHFDTTSTYDNYTGGALVPGLSFQIDALQPMTILARANLLISGISATGAEYSITWLEHVKPDAAVVKGLPNWLQASQHNGTGWAGTNGMSNPMERFVLPTGISTIRVRVARFGTAATIRVNANNVTGSTARLRADRVG